MPPPIKINLTHEQIQERTDKIIAKFEEVMPQDEQISIICMALADMLMNLVPCFEDHADSFLESLVKEYQETGPRRVRRN